MRKNTFSQTVYQHYIKLSVVKVQIKFGCEKNMHYLCNRKMFR
jgi:hypothetical protein